jgi:hypothetical protein
LSSSTTPTAHSNPTAQQSTRLQSLHASLSSLVSSTTNHFSADRLQDQIKEFQTIIDRMEMTYNPFQTDFLSSTSTSSTIGEVKTGATTTVNKKDKDSELNRFKAEIRSFKGALLSSRNFPTARPASVASAQTGR